MNIKGTGKEDETVRKDRKMKQSFFKKPEEFGGIQIKKWREFQE